MDPDLDIEGGDGGDAGSDGGDDGGAGALVIGGATAVAAAGAAALCLSCGVKTVGAWCHACGQKNDDLRRSTLRLARDWVEDTFAFDSRMWRTLALLAAKPGLVPTSYAHGKRSRFTPPVRLFLMVSFLFFLTLSLTSTLFVAVDLRELPKSHDASKENEAAAIVISPTENGPGGDCNFKVSLEFFVRPQDVVIDYEVWRKCRASIEAMAESELNDSETIEFTGMDGRVYKGEEGREQARGFVAKVIGGISTAIENPEKFNADINTWLPRVMFMMAPVLALILALFIRGRNALMFDHLVLSLYSHAAGFAIVGIAIIAAQLGLAAAFPVAMAGLGVYFILALKRAYARGWVKTVWTGVMASTLYLLILISVVITIVVRSLIV